MLLEAQFGPDIAPIARPRLSETSTTSNGTKLEPKSEDDQEAFKEEQEQDRLDQEALEEAELTRLHNLGIPVPGVEIKVDRHVARIWLETLEVECSYPVLRDRVRAVVERGVETVADLWRVDETGGGMGKVEGGRNGTKGMGKEVEA